MGSRCTREARLAWDPLTEVLRSENAVRDALETITVLPNDERLASAVQLARRYLDGWRPRDFPE